MSQTPMTPTTPADVPTVHIWFDANNKFDIRSLGDGEVVNLEPVN